MGFLMSGFILIATGALGIYGIRSTGRRAWKFLQESVTTDATITQLSQGAGRFKAFWRVQVRYEVDGKSYDGFFVLPRDHYPDLHVGGPLPIAYLPNSPQDHQTVYDALRKPREPTVNAPIMILFIVVGIALTLYSFVS